MAWIQLKTFGTEAETEAKTEAIKIEVEYNAAGDVHLTYSSFLNVGMVPQRITLDVYVGYVAFTSSDLDATETHGFEDPYKPK